MKPPIAPRNITSIGTGAPLPSKIGFKTLSVNVAIVNQMVSNLRVFNRRSNILSFADNHLCLLPETSKLISQPLGCFHFNTVACHVVRPATHTAFRRSVPDEILAGFNPALRMGIFFLDMLTRIPAVMDISISVEGAPGCFNVLEQVIDLRVHVGLRCVGMKSDAK